MNGESQQEGSSQIEQLADAEVVAISPENIANTQKTEQEENQEKIETVIEEQKNIQKENERLDRIDEVRKKLEMPPLLNAHEIPLSEVGKRVFERRQQGKVLSLRERLESGRDTVFVGEQIKGMVIKPDHAYRGVDEKTLLKYIQHGSVEGEHENPDIWSPDGGNKGIDWYLGGLALRYGNYIIETPAHADYFVVADEGGSALMANDPFVRHIKSEGGTSKSVPLSRIIAYKIVTNEEQKLSAQKVDLNSFGKGEI